MIAKTESEKKELRNEKSLWRSKMKNHYGPEWTKRTASRIGKDGSRKMNI